jgi:hypothetical protein
VRRLAFARPTNPGPDDGSIQGLAVAALPGIAINEGNGEDWHFGNISVNWHGDSDDRQLRDHYRRGQYGYGCSRAAPCRIEAVRRRRVGIDLKAAIIVDVEATRAIRQAEVGAARTMIERSEDREINRFRCARGSLSGGFVESISNLPKRFLPPKCSCGLISPMVAAATEWLWRVDVNV